MTIMALVWRVEFFLSLSLSLVAVRGDGRLKRRRQGKKERADDFGPRFYVRSCVCFDFPVEQQSQIMKLKKQARNKKEKKEADER